MIPTAGVSTICSRSGPRRSAIPAIVGVATPSAMSVAARCSTTRSKSGVRLPHRSAAVGTGTADGRGDEHALMCPDAVDVDAREVAGQVGVGQDASVEVVDGRRHPPGAPDRGIDAHGCPDLSWAVRVTGRS
jgi:hypothetical protein